METFWLPKNTEEYDVQNLPRFLTPEEIDYIVSDFPVAYSGAVVNNVNVVFQLLYGGDGFEPSKLIRMKMQGTEEAFATFVNPNDLASDINIRAGWIPAHLQQAIEKRSSRKDIDEAVDRLASKTSGRGMGVVESRKGVRELTRMRLEEEREEEEAEFEREREEFANKRLTLMNIINELPTLASEEKEKEKEKEKGKEREKGEREKGGREREKGEREAEREERGREREKEEKKEGKLIFDRASRKLMYGPIPQINTNYKRIVEQTSGEFAIRTERIDNVDIVMVQDSESLQYGTFVRGLSYFKDLKKKGKGLIYCSGSDKVSKIMTKAVAYCSVIAGVKCTLIIENDQIEADIANYYGADIVKVGKTQEEKRKVIDSLIVDKGDCLEFDSNSYKASVKKNLEEFPSMIEETPKNIWLVYPAPIIEDAFVEAFPDSKIKIITFDEGRKVKVGKDKKKEKIYVEKDNVVFSENDVLWLDY